MRIIPNNTLTIRSFNNTIYIVHCVGVHSIRISVYYYYYYWHSVKKFMAQRNIVECFNSYTSSSL